MQKNKELNRASGAIENRHAFPTTGDQSEKMKIREIRPVSTDRDSLQRYSKTNFYFNGKAA